MQASICIKAGLRNHSGSKVLDEEEEGETEGEAEVSHPLKLPQA